MRKEVKVLIKQAEDLGYTWEWAGGSHIRFKHKSTGSVVFTGSTPGGACRSIENALARLRRRANPNHPESRPTPRAPKGRT
jgi:predicted RNA binding protein YcfA (HicA-like mRNA interferase family)